MDISDLDGGAADAARIVQRQLGRIDTTGAGDAVGDDFLAALTAALAAGDMDAEIARLLADADDAARRAGDDAGDALADGMADGAQQAAADTESALGNIQGAAAGAAVAGLFVAGMTSAMDLASVTRRLQSQLNLTEADAERAGSVAGDVFAAGFGADLGEVSDALSTVIGEVGALGDTSDAELTQMTESALALADVMGADVVEAASAAGTLLRSGLVENGQEAFDLLVRGAQTLPSAMGAEIPAVVAEYAQFFDQLGFTGPQMFGLLAQAAQDPTFQIDKLGDAMKEFTLLMADTGAVAEPLQELGLSVEEIQGLINEGQGTAAFDTVIEALRGVEDQTERTRLQAALFGGPGEDMADALLSLDAAGAAASTGMDDAAGAAKQVTDTMEASPAQQLDAAMRTLQTTLGQALLPILMAVSEFMAENQTLMQFAVPIVLAVAAALALMTAAQWAYNAALAASGVGAIVIAIGLLVAGILYLATQTTVFQDIWTAAWGWIKGVVQGVWNWVKQYWPLLLGIITGPFGIAVGLVIQYWDEIYGAISGAINSITSTVGDGIGWVEDRIGDLASLPGQIAGWFSDVGATVADSVSGAWRSAINAVISGWNSLSIPLPSVDLGPLGSIGGGSIDFPNIPYLATGGIATGPTLAMIGEGTQREAIIPLDRLDSMMRGVAGAVHAAPSREDHLIVELRPRELFRLVDVTARERGGSTAGVLRRGGSGA